MESIPEIINHAFTEKVYKCILSSPVQAGELYRKIVLNYLDDFYFIEKYTKTQVFHEKKSFTEAKVFIQNLLGDTYRNLNCWNIEAECIVQISQKGKILYRERKNIQDQKPKIMQSHNREKNYIFKQGTIIQPLIDMGVFTTEGKLIHSMSDKFKQINRFIEIIDDEIEKNGKTKLHVLDFGCGKSYLTFLLYYYFTEIKKIDIKMTGLDLKQDVIEKCNSAAEKYGYKNLTFQAGDIRDYHDTESIDMVVTLHACDTATDYALFHAIHWKTDMIFSVPCCQHEINSQIESEAFSILTRYGLVKERFSALITDAIRCNLVAYCGYKVQIVEFVDLDHTPKNIMIRAVKTRRKRDGKSLAEAETVIKEFHLKPKLYELLKDAEYIG